MCLTGKTREFRSARSYGAIGTGSMLTVSCVLNKVPVIRNTYHKALDGSVDENAEAHRNLTLYFLLGSDALFPS